MEPLRPRVVESDETIILTCEKCPYPVTLVLPSSEIHTGLKVVCANCRAGKSWKDLPHGK